MKERSSAVAMMVLHMSSHMVSGGGDVRHMSAHFISYSICFFAKCRCFFPVFFRNLTLYDFPLAEAFLSVTVADSVAGMNPHPQASLVAPDHLFSFRDMTRVKTENNADTGTSLTNSMGQSMFFVLVQSCGHIDGSLLSTASQKLSGHVRRSGEQVE